MNSAITQALIEAKAHHSAGRLSDAERLYRQVLQHEPRNAEVHYYLGMARHELGHLNDAEAHLQEATRLEPSNADAYHRLGVVLAHQGKLDEAINSFQDASRLKPESVEIQRNLQFALAIRVNNLGRSLAEDGKLTEASAYHERALELRSDFTDAHDDLASVLVRQNRLDEAVACYRASLAMVPNRAEIYNKLGFVLERQNKLDEAANCYREALKLKPDSAGAHNHLGVLLLKQGNLDDAAVCFRQAVSLQLDHADAVNNLGVTLMRQARHVEAAACYRRALELKPDYVSAHYNLGIVLTEQGKLDEATACYQRTLQLNPRHPEAYYNLAYIQLIENDVEQAADSCRRALELRPDYADAHHTYAMVLLLMGKLIEGWTEYKWREQRKQHQLPGLPQPRWTGGDIAGRTVLLRSEQGHGDALQFIRYAPMVRKRGASVVLECPAALARLLATCEGVNTVIATGDPMPQFDVHAPLLSLPGIFGTTLDNIPAEVPYLSPDPQLVEQSKAELGRKSGFRIGIAWQGNPAHVEDRRRSFPLSQFFGISRISGIQLYSLQLGAGREQLAEAKHFGPIMDLSDRLGDFYNTAAIMRNMDLVITCDSAPAHLAGALGIPVWVALGFASDWRWMLKRADSPWYPSMRLFRQTRLGDWDGVFQAIQVELVNTLRSTAVG